MSKTRFVIAPCMGVGKVVATVTRRAAYLVRQRHPRTTALLSLPALLAGGPEQRDLVRDSPVILLDGCGERCGMHILHQLGVSPFAKIEVAQIMAETRTGPGKTRRQPEESGQRLAEAVAACVERAMRNKALLKSFRPAKELKLAPPKPECARSGGDLTAGQAADAKPRRYVTVFPCQGLRRTGGRVAQRAGYILVEEKFPGNALLLCLPALAAAVQEDIDMLEQFPTVAINGCGMRCASVNAARHGVPAAVSVDLDAVDPRFKGERECLLPDLTEAEAQEAVRLAEACSAPIRALLAGACVWKPGKADLLGMVNQPAKINEVAGFRKCDQGYLTRRASNIEH